MDVDVDLMDYEDYEGYLVEYSIGPRRSFGAGNHQISSGYGEGSVIRRGSKPGRGGRKRHLDRYSTIEQREDQGDRREMRWNRTRRTMNM